MKKPLLYAGIAFLTLWQTGCTNRSGENQEITSKELMTTVEYLASEQLNGRLAGSEGYNTAARYVADEFKTLGVSDAGFEDYYQRFSLEYNHIESSELTIQNGDSIQSYQLGTDYICRGFSGSGDVKAPVVFCGYGISRPEMGYDDFDDVDVSGKVVMQFKTDPRWKLNDQSPGYRSLRKKVKAAREHGALAIIYVSTPNSRNPQKPIGSVMYGEGKHDENFPQIHISLEAAGDLFRNSGYNLKDLQTAIDREKSPRSVELPVKAHIRVKADYQPKKPSMNVVGMIEGDSLKDEYLVLGAHLDHVGGQAGQVYFPGANDNASGVASILEIAEAFALNDKKPARSILFVAFSAEEQGLNGARYFVDHLPVPHEKIVAMINFDCVAHGDSIVVGGGRSFPELYRIAVEEDEAMRGMVIDRTWGGGGADATPFYERGISTLYFATKNSYTWLHLPGDKPETLNTSLHEYLTRVGYKTALRLAEGEYQPKEN